MGAEIAWAVEEKEQESTLRRDEVSVRKMVKKYVYSLPSGRKMTVVLDDEAELTPVAA
ncbi:MAG TPA: hypothetical protein VMW64_00135 [Dehalococcoidia bacterium]|nr:hypothetical protein [Dehalococcoidia bacterium]